MAEALGISLEDVRGLTEDADPAARMEAVASVLGFRLRVDLYVDPRRVVAPTLERLAADLARILGVDLAHHDGSSSPYGYVLVKPDGRRFATDEIADESDELHLDEDPDFMRPLT